MTVVYDTADPAHPPSTLIGLLVSAERGWHTEVARHSRVIATI